MFWGLAALGSWCSERFNVAALLIIGGYLMRFFPPYSSRDQKNDRLKQCVFFWGGLFFGVCCSCVLMVNLKAATT